MLIDGKKDQLKFVQALLCPVCLCSFDEVPKILPQCGHSFCGPCLEQWMLASGCVESGRLHCPVCKCQTSLNLSRDLRRHFQENDYSDYDDRQYEAECIVNYLVDKFLPDNPIFSTLYKSCKKRSFFSRKSQPKTLLSAVQNMLKCPVCNEDFDEQPRMLPSCLHSVCLTCLRRSYKKSDEEFGSIACPSCWVVHKFRNVSDECYEYDGGCEKIEVKSLWTTSGPPSEELGKSLPFDYLLNWMLENAPVIKKELGA